MEDDEDQQNYKINKHKLYEEIHMLLFELKINRITELFMIFASHSLVLITIIISSLFLFFLVSAYIFTQVIIILTILECAIAYFIYRFSGWIMKKEEIQYKELMIQCNNTDTCMHTDDTENSNSLHKKIKFISRNHKTESKAYLYYKLVLLDVLVDQLIRPVLSKKQFLSLVDITNASKFSLFKIPNEELDFEEFLKCEVKNLSESKLIDSHAFTMICSQLYKNTQCEWFLEMSTKRPSQLIDKLWSIARPNPMVHSDIIHNEPLGIQDA